MLFQTDDKFALVANQGNKEQPSNTISKVDLASKKVVATIEAGKGAHGVVTSNDNKFVYVTNMYENTVSVIENNANKVIETVANPFGGWSGRWMFIAVKELLEMHSIAPLFLLNIL